MSREGTDSEEAEWRRDDGGKEWRRSIEAPLVCPAGGRSCGMKGSRRGLATPTVAEPPGRNRKGPMRKGGRQKLD